MWVFAGRYLNNPEIMSGAAFFGLAMISGSKLVFALAVLRYLSQWWFLSNVEKYVILHASQDQCILLMQNVSPFKALTCGNYTAIHFAVTQAL